jgi:hypothetical protein
MTASGPGPKSPGRLRVGTLLLVLGLYFAALVALVAVTLAFEIPLSAGEGFLVFPSPWSLFIAFATYLAPPLIAFGFGWRLRPFARHAAALWLAILLVQGGYSLAVTLLHADLVAAWNADRQASAAAILELAEARHVLHDDDGDGLIDRVALDGRVRTRGLPPGDYRVTAILTETPPGRHRRSAGPMKFPRSSDGSGPLDLAFAFDLDAAGLAELAAAGPMTLHVEVAKSRAPDAYAMTVLRLCAWAPFGCPTSRGGGDPEIHEEIVTLRRFENLGEVALAPAEIQRKQVIFKGFAGDFGRDLDGNGRFDELVVVLEVDSIHDGPIFFQAEMRAPFRALLHHETRSAKGAKRLEFVIDGTAIRRAGRDGPYELGGMVLLNNSPYCPGGVCPPPHLPKFSLSLGSYTTAPYRAEQFE